MTIGETECMGDDERPRTQFTIKLRSKFPHARRDHVEKEDIGRTDVCPERIAQFQVHTAPHERTPEKTEKSHCRNNLIPNGRTTREHPLRRPQHPTVTCSQIKQNLVSPKVRKFYHRPRNMPGRGNVWHTEHGVMAHRESEDKEKNNTDEYESEYHKHSYSHDLR